MTDDTEKAPAALPETFEQAAAAVPQDDISARMNAAIKQASAGAHLQAQMAAKQSHTEMPSLWINQFAAHGDINGSVRIAFLESVYPEIPAMPRASIYMSLVVAKQMHDILGQLIKGIEDGMLQNMRAVVAAADIPGENPLEPERSPEQEAVKPN